MKRFRISKETHQLLKTYISLKDMQEAGLENGYGKNTIKDIVYGNNYVNEKNAPVIRGLVSLVFSRFEKDKIKLLRLKQQCNILQKPLK